MYKITCCRMGKWPKANIGKKGCFIREFETLYDFAIFLIKVGLSCFFLILIRNLREKNLDGYQID